VARHGDEVDVIVHEAVAPGVDAVGYAVLAVEVEVQAVLVATKDGLAAVASPRKK
jgi:hypothetical protein